MGDQQKMANIIHGLMSIHKKQEETNREIKMELAGITEAVLQLEHDIDEFDLDDVWGQLQAMRADILRIKNEISEIRKNT